MFEIMEFGEETHFKITNFQYDLFNNSLSVVKIFLTFLKVYLVHFILQFKLKMYRFSFLSYSENGEKREFFPKFWDTGKKPGFRTVLTGFLPESQNFDLSGKFQIRILVLIDNTYQKNCIIEEELVEK